MNITKKYLISISLMLIIRSDFMHNGVESEQNGTLIFAYGNDPSIKKTKVREGGKSIS